MRLSLKTHPDTPSPPVRRLEVEVTYGSTGRLSLRYVLEGETADLKIAAPAASIRSDRLWEHMCFEIFLRSPGEPGYFEFNFAPSTRWAAYRLRSYRSGMAELEIAAPSVQTSVWEERLEMRVELDLAALPAPPVWQLGLSAIVEDSSGGKSYWALAHPPGEPDFHHSDCFAAELAAAA